MIKDVEWSYYYELARLCKAAYAGPIRHTKYTFGGNAFKHQLIVHGSYGRGYCRIFWNTSDVVIAFRGTRELVDWWISNFKAIPVNLRDCDDSNSVKVHRGFQKTLDYGDKTTELRSLDAVFEHLEENELLDRRITITGHSLGGALAKIFALKLRARWPEHTARNLFKIVSFGSPAAGLKSYYNYFSNLHQITVRVVNKSDIVPFTPPFFYYHVGKELWLGEKLSRRNAGALFRLRYFLINPFSGVSDHNIQSYIDSIKNLIKSTESEK